VERSPGPAGEPFARPIPRGTALFPPAATRTVQLLTKLPGVGDKTAQRYALHLATADRDAAREIGEALIAMADTVEPCARCGHLAESSPGGEPPRCAICADPRRDPALLCVVARVSDLLAIERSGAMRGRYFVLGRLLSPLDGVGSEDLPLDALRARVRDRAEPVTEVLVATPPSVDGEATALLVARELAALGVRVTRIASGVPHGGDLEFADQVTIGRAIEGRKSFG
jgi:recombination protein RecR